MDTVYCKAKDAVANINGAVKYKTHSLLYLLFKKGSENCKCIAKHNGLVNKMNCLEANRCTVLKKHGGFPSKTNTKIVGMTPAEVCQVTHHNKSRNLYVLILHETYIFCVINKPSIVIIIITIMIIIVIVNGVLH